MDPDGWSSGHTGKEALCGGRYEPPEIYTGSIPTIEWPSSRFWAATRSQNGWRQDCSGGIYNEGKKVAAYAQTTGWEQDVDVSLRRSRLDDLPTTRQHQAIFCSSLPLLLVPGPFPPQSLSINFRPIHSEHPYPIRSSPGALSARLPS
jgi:hypothetical protein